jgi:hypothetical protein
VKEKGIAIFFVKLPVLLFILLLVFIIYPVSDLTGQVRDESDPIFPILAPEWQITGSTTFRSDYFENKGDDSQSPYSYTGIKSYNEFNINFNKRTNPYDTWRGEISGVFSGSPYRSNDYGIVPERLNLTKEKGDAAVPFRLEMGDIFSYYTYRTMQTSLKGAQLDLQPFSDSSRKHSFLITSGAQMPSWRDIHPSDNYFNGASYLLDDPVFGKYSMNFVYNTRQGNEDQGTTWRSQMVYGISGSNTVKLGNQKVLLEGEAARFSGDHDGLTGAESGQDKNDKGLFFQASGSSKWPLTYRVRYEEYGSDFRPAGATIASASRNMEGHLGWLFLGGYQLRGRIQKMRDNLESENPTDTKVYGINLTGSIGSLDVFLQDANNKDDTADSLTSNINLNVNLPRIAGWNGRIGFLYQNFYNRVPGSDDTETKQINANADRALSFWGLTGNITPGFVLRKIDSYTSKVLELSPTLALGLRKGPHSIDYNLSWFDQRRLITNGVDVVTSTQNLNYRYTKQKYIIGIECSAGYRTPDTGGSTDYYKFGTFFTYYFEKPVMAAKPVKADIEKVEIPSPSPISIDIVYLSPGSKIDAAVEILRKSNIIKPVIEEGLMVYETRLFEEIELRQRLALVHQRNVLKKSAFIIDYGFVSRPEDVMRFFEKVKSILLNRYGSPTSFYERGTVSRNLVDDIRTGAFIRLTEWSRPGGTIRFGMPRRLDGQVRMEIQFAETFPPPTETLWSIEEVR